MSHVTESGDVAEKSYLSTVRTLLPYLWPDGRPDLKARIVLAMMALVVAKVFTIAIPLLNGAAIDALDPSKHVAQTIGVAVSLILIYGLSRIVSQGFAQLRDAVAAKAVYNAVQAVAGKTFRH